MKLEDLRAVKQYLPMVLVHATAQDAAKTLDHLTGLLTRVDEELAEMEKDARQAAEAPDGPEN